MEAPPLPPAVALTPTQARWYAATQPFIVEKEPLFAHAAHAVLTPSTRPRSITEIGIGPGGFLAHAAAHRWLRAPDRLMGVDLSAAMIQEARQSLAAHGCEVVTMSAEALEARPLPERAALLVSGLNALDVDHPRWARLLPPSSQDVIVLSQAEHYAPNSADSPLAHRLTAVGLPWVDKAAWRRWLMSRLKPKGWLVVIDDYAAPTEEENQRWLAAWDAHVARQWARAEVISQLAATDAAAAARVARHYHPKRPWSERLALVRRVRERRRRRAAEEVQPLPDTRESWQTLFTPGHWQMMPHPNQEAFPLFFLWLGQRE